MKKSVSTSKRNCQKEKHKLRSSTREHTMIRWRVSIERNILIQMEHRSTRWSLSLNRLMPVEHYHVGMSQPVRRLLMFVWMFQVRKLPCQIWIKLTRKSAMMVPQLIHLHVVRVNKLFSLFLYFQIHWLIQTKSNYELISSGLQSETMIL